MKNFAHRLLVAAILIVGVLVVMSNRKAAGQGEPSYTYGADQVSDERCWETCP